MYKFVLSNIRKLSSTLFPMPSKPSDNTSSYKSISLNPFSLKYLRKCSVKNKFISLLKLTFNLV